VLINSLALWQNSAWTKPWTSKKSDQHHFGFGVEILAFLGLGVNALFHSRLCRSGGLKNVQSVQMHRPPT